MRKTLLFIALLLSTFTTSYAQSKIGLRAGAGLSSITDGDTKFGTQLGIVAYSDMDQPLFLQTGILLNSKGTKFNFSEDSDDLLGGLLGDLFNSKMSINYLELPVNLGFNYNLTENIKLSPYVGLYGAYALSGKLKFGFGSFDLFKPSTLDSGDDYEDEFWYDEDDLEEKFISPVNRFDFGANVGANILFNKKVGIIAQYSYGLGNIYKEDPKANNKQLSLGLTFLL